MVNEGTKQPSAKAAYNYKILKNKTGNETGFVSIPFYPSQNVGLNNARYFDIDEDGELILLENVKTKHSPVNDYFINGIFFNDLKTTQFKCTRDLPEEYYVTYSYEIVYNDLKFIDAFFLQNSGENVLRSSLTFKKNPNVQIDLHEINLSDQIVKEENNSEVKYTASELKIFQRSSSSVNGSYFLPHIIPTVASFVYNGAEQNMIRDVADLYQWYNSLVSQLQSSNGGIKNLAEDIAGEGSELERIDRIFKWVQSNIHYLAFEDGIAGFKPEEASIVCQNLYGDCKGMANLLVQLLQSQGIDARHGWLGTRSKPYTYKIPSLVTDNHMICVVKQGEDYIFLDATDKSATLDRPPESLEGKEILVAHGEQFEIVKIPITEADGNRIELYSQIFLDEFPPRMSIEVKLFGHYNNQISNAFRYFTGTRKKWLPFFIHEQYFQNINPISISEVQFGEEFSTFQIQGNFLDFSSDDESITLFPMANIFSKSYLKEGFAFEYVSFKHKISQKVKIHSSTNMLKSHIQDERWSRGKFESYFDFDSKKDELNIVFINDYLVIDRAEYENYNAMVDFENAKLNYFLKYER